MAKLTVPYVVLIEVDAPDHDQAEDLADTKLYEILMAGSKAIGTDRPHFENGCDYANLEITCTEHSVAGCDTCEEEEE